MEQDVRKVLGIGLAFGKKINLIKRKESRRGVVIGEL